MTIYFQRRLTGQAPWGVFRTVGGRVEKLHYVAIHLGTWRISLYWRG